METFAELIVNRRQELGLSVRELAKLLNEKGYSVSFPFINFIETERKKPSYNLAYALADVLDIDLREALTKAYRARMEHDRQLERDYIDKLIEDKAITGIAADEIIKSG